IFERVRKFRDGGTFNIKIESIKPREYYCHCSTKNQLGEYVDSYSERFGSGTLTQFREWSNLLINKFVRNGANEDFVKSMSDFFVSLEK
ncbi:MAG: hypothetical protein MJ231_07670, partial [bacterium]|nr:hypothetical protein [bacterium]